MRLVPLAAALGVAVAGPTLAQAAKPAAKPGAAAPNPVVATVNNEVIRLSDVGAAAGAVPAEVRQQIPPEVLYQKLLDQLISRKALLIEARKEGLDRDPAVQKQMQNAADQVLQTTALQRAVLPKLNEEAIKAEYDKEYAGKPGEEEVHARHILVDSEAQAKDIIKQLEAGAKFGDLAKKYSKDPGAANGGDLGFFKKGDMLPEFSAAAFALKPNQFTHTPVHTRYGWHVIQVLETRVAQPPTYDQVRGEIQQQLMQKDVQAAVAAAKSQVRITMYNADGTPVKPGAAPALPTGRAAAPAAPSKSK